MGDLWLHCDKCGNKVARYLKPSSPAPLDMVVAEDFDPNLKKVEWCCKPHMLKVENIHEKGED